MNKLYVVGLGPGDNKKMTVEAAEILDQCEVIAGYSVYIDLIKEKYGNKEFIVSGMRQEEERCRKAVKKAEEGYKTAVVCSGDSGVYGMAGLIMELCQERKNIEVEVVAGVTAALSGGALLGAPLGHDFSVISLSDLMTPWEKIEMRLKCAAMCDMVICLYNPSSRKRKDYLKKACEIVMEYKEGDTVCGYVKNIGRKGEEWGMLSLNEMKDFEADMFTTVFIGNSETRRIKNQMVTPRGYRVE